MNILSLLVLSGCGSVINFGGFRHDDPGEIDLHTTSGDDTGGTTTDDTGGTTTDDTGGTTTDDTGGTDTATTIPSELDVSAYTGSWTAGASGVTELGVGVHPWFVAVGDFDDDGLEDLAYSWNVELFGGDELNLAVHLQDGSGGLGAAVNLATGHDTAFAGSFRVADLDGDGDDDLVAGHDDGVSVFLSDGSGGFSGPTDYSSTEGTTVRVGDLDGDADPDLLTLGNAGDLQVWTNDGSGAFSAGWDGLTVSTAYGTAAALVDLDDDGDLDLAAGDPDGMTIKFHALLNDGTGAFDTGSPVAAPAEGPMVTGMTALDLDGDGDDEVVAAGGFTSTYSMFVGGWAWDGAGFGDYLHLDTPTNSAPTGVVTGDLDGDGDLDLFSANALFMYGTVAFSQGGGAWSVTTLDLGLWNQSDIFPDPIAVGDLNGDGCGDLVWRTDEDVVVAPGSGC